MTVNSHIQIPKCILKHFADSTQRVFYLDTKNGHIGMAGAKKLGTEYGYYSDIQEQFLSKEIENPLSSLATKVRQLLVDESLTITLTQAEETILKRYITTSIARSNLALDTFQKSLGKYSRFVLTNQQKHDFISTFGAINNNGIISLLKNHYLVILVNKTDVNWVVPRNCFYAVSSHEIECIVAPISPQCALCLFPSEYAENNADSLLYRLGVIKDPDFASMMNARALLYEYIYNQTFVASATRSELEKLREYLQNSRAKLDAYRVDVWGNS